MARLSRDNSGPLLGAGSTPVGPASAAPYPCARASGGWAPGASSRSDRRRASALGTADGPGAQAMASGI